MAREKAWGGRFAGRTDAFVEEFTASIPFDILLYDLTSTYFEGQALANPKATRDFLRARLRDRDHEVFCCLFLDNRHRVICFEEVFRGTLDGASVHPREVVKLALSRNAAAVILAHNHPSGVAEPSQADELITGRLRDALALVDIRVLDHIVVGDGAEVSFADPRRSYTSSFERYALELGRRMTIRDVAAHLGVGWDLIKDIQKRDLSRRLGV